VCQLTEEKAGEKPGGQPEEQAKDKIGSLGQECCVCLNENPMCGFIPCGHCCACEECGKDIMKESRQCPICRQQCTGILKLFFS